MVVSQWLHRAVALSGADGPIQQMSLRQVLDWKPEWDRRESETGQQLARGDIPMFVAARSLNRSLVGLMLIPALVNLSESDPRQRSIIAAYSGKRQLTLLGAGASFGIDATALLTLSLLNVLDPALDTFGTVHVPHSTLAWLFEEKQRAAFHQPSRIRDAHRVRDLLASDALEKLLPSTVPDSDLSAQIGEELALLIAEAERPKDADHSQCIVVRSAPVHRVASLMEEEADLTAHAAVLSSCQAVVDKLRQMGQITADEEKSARAYLRLHEKPWPNQPAIEDGAILYLDDLAMTCFLHLGLLGRLRAAGLRPIASPKEVAAANELISYESISGKVNDAIERIRHAVNTRVESGRIRVGRRGKSGQSAEASLSEHPTLGVLALAEHCDAIIADDRFINQHANLDGGGKVTPILSTLDLLDGLVTAGSMTPEGLSECRTLLRRAGYVLVPVDEDELARHLDASAVKGSQVAETAELKAIRESILRVRMSAWLQLPKEALWLDSLLKAFIRALKHLWKADADVPTIRARSNWIVDQLDVRGWAHSLGDESGDNLVKAGRAAHIGLVLLPPADAPPHVKDEYWRWIDETVLAPIEEEDPELYSRLVEGYRRQIADMADTELTERGRGGE